MTGPKPSISIAYGKFQMEVGSDDDSDSSDYYSDDSSDHDSSDDSHIVAQRVHLNKHENDRVLQLLPFTGHNILCWCSFCDSLFDDHKFEET